MDDDPATEILEATYRALCRHGYADLTVKDIADEADRSKASIHYYYDSKENLFLEFLYDRYTTQLAPVDGETPPEQLFVLLETTLVDDGADPAVAAEFLVTAITGAHTRRAAVDHPPERVYETVTQYAETQLIADSETEAVA